MCSKRVVEDEYHFILECIIYNVSYRMAYYDHRVYIEANDIIKIIFI
jgi:hypothetical protein